MPDEYHVIPIPEKFNSIEEIFDFLLDNYPPVVERMKIATEVDATMAWTEHDFWRDFTYFTCALATKLTQQQLLISIKLEEKRKILAFLKTINRSEP